MGKDRFASYFVPVVSKTLDILEAFQSTKEELSLEEIIRRTGMAHGTAYRILFTLVHRGYLVHSLQPKKYRVMPSPHRRKIGYCSVGEQSFANQVAASLEMAARSAGFGLIMLSNEWDRDNGDRAIRNAQKLVTERVDVAINFQFHASVAPVIADIFARAKIPTIAVEIPQPGAIYYGVDNYRAGWDAGEVLARHALSTGNGKVDLIVLLDTPAAGEVEQSRLTGVLKSLEQTLGPMPNRKVCRVDGKGTREASKLVTADVLRTHPRVKRILLSAANDISALGGLDALRAAGRDSGALIVGFGGMPEALAEISNPKSPYIATVSFWPNQYGPGLIKLVGKVLAGEPVAPFHTIQHQTIDRVNLGRYFPTVLPQMRVDSPAHKIAPTEMTNE